MEKPTDFKSEEIKKHFSQQRKILANKLLDLSARNPLIRTNLRSSKTATSTQLRFVNDPLEQIFAALKSEKAIGFESITKPKTLPEDEESAEFKAGLEALRQEDVEYKANIEKLGDDASERELEKLERKLRDKLRENLGMAKVDKVIPSIEDQAQKQNINPSYELPAFDFDNSERVRKVSSLQTLKYPEDLERSLRQIHSQARLRESETGINFLSIALGFLEWYAADASEKPFLSPLIICSVRIEKTKNGDKVGFSVSQESDPALNLCLREKLLSDHGIVLPEFDPEGSVEKYLGEITNLIQKQKDWKVRRFSLLGFYSFAKLVMHKDLLEENWDEEAGAHGILSELFGTSGGGPDSQGEDYEVDQPKLRTLCPTLPLPADASQISAVIDVLKGENLALEGPPGTGKSQTIANLIGALTAKGKTVLFIAEKKAALDVVKSRLDKAGLGEICLELHSAKTKKSEIAKMLVNQLADNRASRKKITSQSQFFDPLFQVIDGLNKRSETLNEIQVDSAISLFQKIGKYLLADRSNPELKNLPSEQRIDNPFNNSEERIQIGGQILEEAKDCLKKTFPGMLTNFFWFF